MVFKKKEETLPELHIDNSEHYAQATSERLLSLKDLEEIFSKGYMLLDSVNINNKFYYTFLTTGTVESKEQKSFPVTVNIPANSQEEAEKILMDKLK